MSENPADLKPEEGATSASAQPPEAAATALTTDPSSTATTTSSVPPPPPEEDEDPKIMFKVKTSADTFHSITMAESASVMDLKTKLASSDFENIPVERQRLIYSGRVMKNEEALATYKIKPGNTIHMVRSAASNPAPPSSTTPVAQAVPTNMAAGTANSPLTNLTGARFAGMNINLPSREMFGADGGLGAPPGPDEIARLLRDPNYVQTVVSLLDNPEILDAAIQTNPILRNMPNAREMLQSPMVRSMLTNPEALNAMTSMRGMMGFGGGGQPFPAPGATDTTPQGAAAAGAQPNNGAAGAGAGAGMNPFSSLFRHLPGDAIPSPFSPPPPSTAAGQPGGSTNNSSESGNNSNSSNGANQQMPPGFNGFPPIDPEAMRVIREAMFPQAAGGADAGADAGAGAGALGAAGSLFGNAGGDGGPPPLSHLNNPDALRETLNRLMLTRDLGGSGTPTPPADNRPPEERYATQLGQLNDMGFTDFDRNVAALRRSGGNVQGAVEHLLSG